MHMDVTLAGHTPAQVEATVSRVLIRVGSAVLGSTAGYLVMYDAALAGTPAALAAIVCFFAGVAAPVTDTPCG